MKKKPAGAGKATGGKLIGNDKIVDVGSGSQKIDIPLEKAGTTK